MAAPRRDENITSAQFALALETPHVRMAVDQDARRFAPGLSELAMMYLETTSAPQTLQREHLIGQPETTAPRILDIPRNTAPGGILAHIRHEAKKLIGKERLWQRPSQRGQASRKDLWHGSRLARQQGLFHLLASLC